MEARRWEGSGHLKCIRGVNVYALIEEAVAAHTVPAEAADSAGNFEGCPTIDTGSLHPRRLAGRVVGHLVLEENVGAAIPVPDHLVLLVVLNEKAVGGHVVTVDYDSGVGSVAVPPHTVAVVGTPCPDVIEDDIIAVDYQTARRPARLGAADTEEYIVKSRRVGGYIVTARVTVSDL